MPVDAYRTAKARQAGETLSDPLDSFTKERPIGPILLIGEGLLLLLHNFDWFPWYRISQFFWHAILIGAGVLMMRKRLDRRSLESLLIINSVRLACRRFTISWMIGTS